MGDYNTCFLESGYRDGNTAGREIRNCIKSHYLELLCDAKDTPIYSHYIGSRTYPNLLITTNDILSKINRIVISEVGCRQPISEVLE